MSRGQTLHSRMPWTSLMKHATSPSYDRRNTSRCCVGIITTASGGAHSTSATWCCDECRARRIATSSPHRGKVPTSYRKCFDLARTSCRPPTVKSSPMHGTSNSYVISLLNTIGCMNILRVISKSSPLISLLSNPRPLPPLGSWVTRELLGLLVLISVSWVGRTELADPETS